MDFDKTEVRANVKFLTKLGWSASDIIAALVKVYEDHAPKKSAVYKWIKRFKGGREVLEDNHRQGRPSTSTTPEQVDAVQALVDEDRRVTVLEIAQTLDISTGSVDSILRDQLGLSKLSARWVPKALRPEQMAQRADLAIEFLNRYDQNPDELLGRLVTGDETWIYQYDPEAKHQSKMWLPKGSSGPIKFKSERSILKIMATIFWDAEGVILIDFLVGQRTVTGAYYADVLRKLHSAIAEKRPGKLGRRILFHHDNAPAHSSRVARDVLREYRWEILTHPPYSPDLAPSDFFCFQS